MVETSKQVRVDNWGIYFLQRLQLFFSKTDFCDLTLQFEGNVQLKVHRLVMNACTEYFAFLEQTCPAMEENTIMMPADLQADVVVPIVNFMYTGMLEFHPSIYDRLYRASETMNIAVLTKLLEAQLAPVSRILNKKNRDKDLINWKEVKRTSKPVPPPPVVTNDLPPVPTLPPLQQAKKVPFWKKRPASNVGLQSHPVSSTFTTSKWSADPVEKDPLAIMDNTPKPTRFEWPEDDISPIPAVYSSFDEVSLTSKPLWTKEDEQKAAPVEEPRKIQEYPRRNSNASQDLDDEFVEKEQKVKLEEATSSENPSKRRAENKPASSPKRIKITNQEDETVISIMTSNPSEVDHTKIVSEILKKYPDLVKKKRNIKLKITQSKTDQCEVRVQSSKEFAKSSQIKVEAGGSVGPLTGEFDLRWVATGSQENDKLSLRMINKAPVEHYSVEDFGIDMKELHIKLAPSADKNQSSKKEMAPPPPQPPPAPPSSIKEPTPAKEKKDARRPNFKAASEEGPWTCLECFDDTEGSMFVLYYLFRKHMSDHHQMEFEPSLCKYCGKNCPKDNLLIYHLYTKHGLKPPRNVDFPKCNFCPFIAVTTERLQQHQKTHVDGEVQCSTCFLGFSSKRELSVHLQMAGHSARKSSILDCAYCMKKLQSPVTLFTHVRAQHMKEARRDGVTSLDEVMDIQEEDVLEENGENEEQAPDDGGKSVPCENTERAVGEKPLVKERVKIISNLKVARSDDYIPENNVAKEVGPSRLPDSGPVAVTTTAAALGNIGGSLATNLGLVDIVVLDDNQQYILQQPPGQSGNAEFILPHELASSEGILQAAAAASGELNSTDELVMVLTDHDYQDEQHQGQPDNSNIVVLYSHPVEGQQGQFITSQGNLLVNSQGVLEIRNGSGITTTAGQILVNNDSTTTTQAVESPIESIDLIKKEIEASDHTETDKESIKTVLRKKVLGKDIRKTSTPVNLPAPPPPPPTLPLSAARSAMESNAVAEFVENGKDHNPTPVGVDATDSSVPDEPMDVDEALAEQKEYNEENSGQKETLVADTSNASKHLEPEQRAPLEDATSENSTQEKEQAAEISSQDVPPTADRNKETLSNSMLRDVLIMNDPNNFQPMPSNDNVSHQESMEVDSGKVTETNENIQGVDEVDNQLTDNVPEVVAGDIQETIREDVDKGHVGSEPQNDESQVNQHEEAATCQDNPKNGTGPDESQMENSDPQPLEQEINDSNDNIQGQFEDFTDESQQSSSQKGHKDLNKAILDDWDDTDSQQSQSQEREQDSQESEQDRSVSNAAENVTKLMDDWDEEDEEQVKV